MAKRKPGSDEEPIHIEDLSAEQIEALTPNDWLRVRRLEWPRGWTAESYAQMSHQELAALAERLDSALGDAYLSLVEVETRPLDQDVREELERWACSGGHPLHETRLYRM